MKSIFAKKYQQGGSMTDKVRKTYGLDRPNNDTWLDVPQKTAMYLMGKGYQKPSDYLYAHGLGDTNAAELKAFIADGLIDPLNLVGVGEVKNAYKMTKTSASLLNKGLKAANIADQINDTGNYIKNKASQANDWLGENTGYKFEDGGQLNNMKKSIFKKYGWGGDISKLALDNLTSPLNAISGVDIYKPKYETEGFKNFAPKYSAVADGISKIGLNVGLGMLTGGAGNVALGSAQAGGKAVYDGANNEQFNNIAKYGGLLRNYQMDGNLPQNILPQNPNDLQDETENTLEYEGSSHKQGGIPLNNGAELEKDETVIKQGAIGNQDPYAISPNLVLDRQTAKLVGLSNKYSGRKLSDISRMIEDMKPQNKNNVMSEKTNAMNKKFALNRLIKANEILSAKHRQENPVKEKSDLRQEEMAQMQLGGKMPEDFMAFYQKHSDYTGGLDVMWNNPSTWTDYQDDYNSWKSNLKPNLIDNTNLQGSQPQYVNKWNKDKGTLSSFSDLGNNPAAFLNKTGVNYPDNQINLNPSNQIASNWQNNSGLSVNSPNGLLQTNALGVNSPTTNKGFDLQSNLGNIGMGLKGASLLANFATIGKKPGQIPAQFNPYTNDILNNYRNTIDNQSIKNDITSAVNTGLNSTPSRNWNVQRAMNAELVGKGMDAMSKANLQGQELNNRYRSELGAVQNNLGQQNVAAKNNAEVLNAQTQANWRNNLRSAIGNVGNDVADMTLKKDYLNKYTAEHIKILNEKGREYGLSFTNTQEYERAALHPEGRILMAKVEAKVATPEEAQRLDNIMKGKPIDYTK